MASLAEQETELEAQIATYEAQLDAVRKKMPEMSGGDAEEMKTLMADLKELVDLSKESLMEIKRHKLLLMLQEQVPSSTTTPEGSTLKGPALAAGTGHQETGHQGVEEKEEEEVDELVGTKCRAPLKESWGGESHHNAIILCREPLPPTSLETEAPPPVPEDPEVRVLFTQPLYLAMKPCQFFLEGNCRYSEQECKFSHGHVTRLSKLHPFSEPDYSMAHVGGRCLARHEDGLWYRAVVSSVGEDYVVYFPSLSVTSTVTPDDLLPLESSESSSGSGEESEEGEGEGEEMMVVEWKPSAMKAALGQWEAHTTGIGSKLLAKMGYIVGQGLGKEGQGRVEPVEIVILPAGKSLDVCARLREEKKVKMVDGLQKKRKKRKKKNGKSLAASAAASEGPADMFEFLNTQVFARGSSRDQVLPQKKTETSSGSAKSANLNVKVFEVQEEIKAVTKRKASLKASLLRHQKRKDKQLMEQVKEKLLAVEAHLEQLHKQERNIERDIAAKSDKKKLSIF